MILIRLFTLLLRLSRINNYFSILILQPQRVENNSERNGKKWPLWFQNSSIKKKFPILMKFLSQFHKNPTSKEYGDTIDTLFLLML